MPLSNSILFKALPIFTILLFTMSLYISDAQTSPEFVVSRSELLKSSDKKERALSSSEDWSEKTPYDLFSLYGTIFPKKNRNAASHKWASFILDRAKSMSEAKIKELFRAFCAVSGSPLTPGRPAAWKYSNKLKTVQDEIINEGLAFHCCWPCICDTYDWIKVDQKTIETKDGPRDFNFLVVNDPCEVSGGPDKVKTFLTDKSAPDVRCSGNQLMCNLSTDSDGFCRKCWYSNKGKLIIGMLQDASEVNSSNDTDSFLATDGNCQKRKDSGNRSGMGEIFIDFAKIGYGLK